MEFLKKILGYLSPIKFLSFIIAKINHHPRLKKDLIIISSLILAFFTISFLTPYLIDLEGKKNAFIEEFKQETGREIIIDGKLRLHLLPIPYVSVDKIYISNSEDASTDLFFQAEEIKFYINLLRPITKGYKYSHIEINNSITNLEVTKEGNLSWDLIKIGEEENIFKAAMEKFTHSYNISISNSILNLRLDAENINKSFDNFNLNIHSKDGLSFSGSFDNEEKIAFSGEIASVSPDIYNLNFSLNNAFETLAISGSADLSHKKTRASGNISASSRDARNLLQKIIVSDVASSEDEKKKELSAHASFTLENAVLSIPDMKIDSEFVAGQIYTDIALGFSSIIDLQINLSKLDIDQIIDASDAAKERIKIENIVNNFSITLPKNINLLSELSIDELYFLNGKITNINLGADLYNSELVIYNASAILPGNSNFTFNGKLFNNHIIPKLSGNFDINGDSFYGLLKWAVNQNQEIAMISPENFEGFVLKGEFDFIPQNIYLKNMKGKIDDKSIKYAEFAVKTKEDRPIYDIALDTEMIDLSQYGIGKNLGEYLWPLLKKDQIIEATGKLPWLQNIEYNLYLDINSKQLKFGEDQYNNVSLMMNLKPSIIDVRKLMFSTNNGSDFDIVSMFDLRELKPKLNIEIKSANVTLDTKPINNGKDVVAPKNIISKDKDGRPIWTKELFGFVGFDSFDGNIDIMVKKLNALDFNASNITIKGAIQDGQLTLKNFTADLLGGTMSAIGSANLNKLPVVSISLLLNNFKIEKFLGLFNDTNPISGYASLSTKITAFGTDITSMISKLNGEGNISLKEINLKGMDLDSIIAKTSQISYPEFNNLKAQSLNSGSTQFHDAVAEFKIEDGVISVSKMNMSMDYAAASLAGNIDLNSWLMNVVTNIAFIANITKDQRQSNSTVNFILNSTGLFNKPKLTIDSTTIDQVIFGVIAPNKPIEQNQPLKKQN